MRFSSFIAIIFIFLCWPAFLHAQEERPIIQFIRIEGVQRVEAETVKAYMVIKEGMRDDPVLVDRSVKTLFSSQLFADVKIRREGNGLVVVAVENPIINRVSFEGNVSIRDDKLRQEAVLKPRQVYTRAKVQDDVERFLELYRRSGRFAARIDPKVVQLPQNRVDLIFEINDGPVTKINSINFIGNTDYDDGRLLSEILTSESRWWKFLSSSDNYDPDRIAYDRELLRRFYLSKGYADFHVISSIAELTRDGEEFFVTFNIHEGDIYNFAETTISNMVESLDEDILLAAVAHSEGERYNANRIDKTVDALTKIVGEQGFAFAEIRPRVRRDKDENLVRVDYVIEEGARVYVEQINIVGNTRTQDQVIRRELRLSEGDAFNRVLLSRSERNIRGLNFFGVVNVSESRGSEPDQTVIDIVVSERPTGQATFGISYSSADAASTDISISERNFLGRGYTLSAATRLSNESQLYNFSFGDPYFLGRDIYGSFKLFNTETDYSSRSYTTHQYGGTLTLSYNLSEDGRIQFSYELSEIKADYRDEAEEDAEYAESIFGYYYYIDKRDDKIDPKNGWSIGFGQDIAGPGFDRKYVQSDLTANYYKELAEDWILHLRSIGALIEGYDGQIVEDNERFYISGRTFRGFDRSGVGPRDIETDTALGANKYIVNTLEVFIPTGIPKEIQVNTALFVDFGWVGDNDEEPNENFETDFAFRATYGMTLQWRSAIGPMRFDFARIIEKEDYDKPRFFTFTVGGTF